MGANHNFVCESTSDETYGVQYLSMQETFYLRSRYLHRNYKFMETSILSRDNTSKF